jgi:hypothetical protein
MKRQFLLLANLALLFGGTGDAAAGVVIPGTHLGPISAPPQGIDPTYNFTYSDAAGNAGFGTLVATFPSGIDALSSWSLSGSLTVTSSSDGNASVGTYTLLAGGPGTVYTPSSMFYFDNLVYPADDAGNGAQAGFGAVNSYLTEGGLVFGPVTGTQDEINIFGNGGGDYAFITEVGGSFNIESLSGGTFSLSPVPEAGTLALTGIAAVGWVTFWRRRWRAEPIAR